VFKRSARYFALALTLVALTATVRPAHAQSDDPCTDPAATGCVVNGSDPQPGAVPPPDPQKNTDGNNTGDALSMDDLISSLILVYGLA